MLRFSKPSFYLQGQKNSQLHQIMFKLKFRFRFEFRNLTVERQKLSNFSLFT